MNTKNLFTLKTAHKYQICKQPFIDAKNLKAKVTGLLSIAMLSFSLSAHGGFTLNKTIQQIGPGAGATGINSFDLATLGENVFFTWDVDNSASPLNPGGTVNPGNPLVLDYAFGSSAFGLASSTVTVGAGSTDGFTGTVINQSVSLANDETGVLGFGDYYGFNQIHQIGASTFAIASLVLYDPTALVMSDQSYFEATMTSGFAESYAQVILFDSTTTTSDLVYSTLAPVPVPAAAWLFGSALLGLGATRRARKG